MDLVIDSAQAVKAEQPWALKDLPPYRPVAKKLMLLACREDVPISEVQEVLRSDAAFTADVLRLANSPLISSRGRITGVLQAVMVLGLERIKALATTLALRSFLGSGAPSHALEVCWRHNLATAVVSEKLARLLHIDADTCYTAGLLHDIGQLALLRACPDQYEGILSAAQTTGFDLLREEKSLFSIDHCEAGRWILEQWKFPKELIDVVALHHQKPRPEAPIVVRVVYAAWQIADLTGFSVLNRPVEGNIETIAAVLPGKVVEQLVGQFERLSEEVAFQINSIECSLV